MKRWVLGAVLLLVLVAAARLISSQILPPDPGKGYSPPDLGPLEVGQVHWGAHHFVEYRVGDLPLILSAPHGGRLEPPTVSDRSRGYPIGDSDTLDLTLRMAEAVAQRLGRPPHVILSHLQRAKLDPNREIGLAADGDPLAERAWLDYHGFIDAAKANVASDWQTGLYLDIHGHGHRNQWIELGYLVPERGLALSDKALDSHPKSWRNSIRSLAASSKWPLSSLLRGPTSLGSLLEEQGYRTVPSPGDPGPDGASYFSGGYSTLRHGSFHGNLISGIQVEHPVRGVREGVENRKRYATAFASAIAQYLETHFDVVATESETGS